MNDLILLIFQIDIIQMQAGAELGKAQSNWGLAILKLPEFGHMVVLGLTFSETHNINCY